MDKKTTSRKKKQDETPAQEAAKYVALKDWHLFHNEIDYKIKKGDVVRPLPANLLAALKTEKVI